MAVLSREDHSQHSHHEQLANNRSPYIGVSISTLFKIVRRYHNSLNGTEPQPGENGTQDTGAQSQVQAQDKDENIEATLTDAEMTSARWVWDWLRSRPQILINGHKRYNKLELSEVLALPEAPEPVAATDEPKPPAEKTTSKTKTSSKKGKEVVKAKLPKKLTFRPRIHPSEDLVWQTLTRHGVDYKRVPVLEWKCLLGIASVRGEGILQSDLRRLVDQDKRSLPKRTDSLARKGYIAKRTIVVSRMKTSKLWLIDFAPPILEVKQGGLDLSPENLTKDLEPVAWQDRWTGNNIDMEAFGRTFVGIIKAWGVIRYSDLRYKMGVCGKHWQMKTLAKNSQRFVDMGVLKYTAATFPGSRKVFKDCLKFLRDPRPEEWDKFLATGKKTSQYTDNTRNREPKPNALAVYGGDSQGKDDGKSRQKSSRILASWTPEKPLSQSVFEVIKSAGPEGASNPQISAATVGYAFRRYMASHLNKLCETEQPEHLKKYQVTSSLVRSGKTSAYMYSAKYPNGINEQSQTEGGADPDQTEQNPAPVSNNDPFGFGKIRPRAFAPEGTTFSALNEMAQKPGSKRKDRTALKMGDIKKKESVVSAETAKPKTRTGRPPRNKTGKEISKESEPTVVAERVAPEGLIAEAPAIEVSTPSVPVVEAPTPSEPVTEEPTTQAAQGPAQEAEQFQEMAEVRQPGARIGVPGSLNPYKTRGRPKQSLVITIYSEKLKDPSFLKPRLSAKAEINGTEATAGREATFDALAACLDGNTGYLLYKPKNRTITFSEEEKSPLVLSIDSLDEDPSIRPVPGDDSRCLSLLANGIKDGAAFSYIFIFDDDAVSKGQAEAIQSAIIAARSVQGDIDSAAAQTPQSLEEALGEGAEDDEFAPEESARSRGRGGARGGRGRGGRAARGGRGMRKGQAYPGAPFKCEKCGNTWKNDVGLKYHQTKAKVTCNPNFDPNSVIENMRRRAPPTPALPAPSVVSEGGEEEDDEPVTLGRRVVRSVAVKEKPAPKASAPSSRVKNQSKVRNAVRSVQGAPQVLFRGLAGSSVTEDYETPRGILSEPPSKSLQAPEPARQALALPASPARPNTSMKISFLLGNETAQRAPVVEDRTIWPSFNRNGKTDADGDHDMEAVLNGQIGKATAEPISNLDSVHGDAAPNSTQAADLGPLHDESGKDTQGAAPEAPLADTANASTERSPRKRKRAERDESDAGHDVAPVAENGGMVTKPFIPSPNYDQMATEAKKRTAQAYDIINYLLDNSNGIFPGDKAVFYAMIKVFLKEFRGEIPPTWKNCHAAIKALETRNLARVHTHMLRTETGKLATLSLLVRVGVEPMGAVSLAIRQKMRDTYPTIYIPPPFSPTKEELDFLQELDGKPTLQPSKPLKPNANGEKFRSRRRIDEVEVFNAPYYTQTASDHAPEYRDPFWDRGKCGDLRGQKRSSEALFGSPSKRMRGEDADDIAARLPDEEDGEEPGTANGPTGSQATEAQEENDQASPVDTLLPFGAKRRRRAYKKREPTEQQQRKAKAQHSMTSTPNLWETGSPSVAEAIKVYGLLPPKPGKRGRPRIHPGPRKMTRVQPHLGRISNPGLDSLPPSFFVESDEPQCEPAIALDNSQLEPLPWMQPGSAEEMGLSEKYRAESYADPYFGKFNEYVHLSMTWETSRAGTDFCTAPKGASGSAWINFSPPVEKSNMRPVNLKWAEDRRFALDTMPYQDLEEIAGDENEIPVDSGDGGPQAEPRPAKKRRIAGMPRRRTGVGGRPTKFKLLAIKTGRELTPYPTSNRDFLRVPGDGTDELDWTSEHTKLAAFVVVSTLLGGVDRVVDWGLMMRLFPDNTISQLRHAWCALKKDRQSTIVALTDEFRRAFLKAYASGELPPIDFDNTLAYDWKYLIKWTTQLNGVERILLPATRKILDGRFALPNCRFENREWRESYYHSQRSVFNRFQDACSEPISYPAEVDEKTSKSSTDLNLAVAMSWTRSLCVTPVDLYTTDLILQKRNNLLPGMSKSDITDLILQGIDQLQKDGVISKSTARWSNGRRWRFNNRVPEVLDKMCHEEKLAQAVDFKEELDAKFRPAPGDDPNTPKVKRATYVTRDGMIMALLNLQAQGRVRLVPVDQPHVPMGHEPGNYETRKYTKRYLHFKIDIHPTEKYLYNEDEEIASLRKRLEEAAPPTRGPGGATPAWCDVFEKVDMARWIKYLSMVLNMIASRGAMPPEELAKTLKPVIMVFEVEMILEWGKKLGILGSQIEVEVEDKKTGQTKKVGTALAAREWWWFAVDAQRRRGVKEGSLPGGKEKGKEKEVAGEKASEGQEKDKENGQGEDAVTENSADADGSEVETEAPAKPQTQGRKPLPSGKRSTPGQGEDGVADGDGGDEEHES